MVCPEHPFGWDFIWDHQGVNVYPVQGGQVQQVTRETNSTIGVHFFIVDKRATRTFAADYGHVNIYSLVENRIITQEQAKLILSGQPQDGASVKEGQFLGVTGDDCCPFGVLHISTSYDLWKRDPGQLWNLGEFPDFYPSLHPQYGTSQEGCGY
jgi:hypothetical protein